MITTEWTSSDIQCLRAADVGDGERRWTRRQMRRCAKAAVYRHGRLLWRLVERFPLVHRGLPLSALVSNDGKFVVTLDTSGARGYGYVVVIYRTNGDLIRAIQLDELLTAQDISVLSRSVSSRHWLVDSRIDADTAQLVLKTSPCAMFPMDCDETVPELRLDLASGELVGGRRHRFPFEVPMIHAEETRLAADLQLDAVSGPSCNSNAAREVYARTSRRGYSTLATSQLSADLPEFTVIGRKARLSGRVVLEFLVDESGEVACTAILKNLPMGLGEVSRDAVETWRFSPRPSPVRTVVTLEFSFVDVRPPQQP